MAPSENQVPSLATTALIVCSVIFPVLAFISIGFRAHARRIGGLKLQADDWWIITTWVFTFGLSVNAWTFGSIMGIDYFDINPAIGESKSAQCLWIGSLFLQISLATVKISILFFYKRIFSTRKFKVVAWIGIALITLWGLIFFLIIIFQVDPISTAWTGKGRFTVNATAFGLAQAGTSIALDVVVLGFPLPVIWGLHMQRSRKVAVGIILWLGGFCCVAAIVRLVLLHQVLSTVVQSREQGFALVYVQSKAYIFTIIEPNCSIIAACLPCYGPLLKAFGGRSAESLVRSVRSALSLNSWRGSNGSRGSGRSRHARGQTPYGSQKDLNKKVTTESEVALQDLQDDGWSTNNTQGLSTANAEPTVPSPVRLEEGRAKGIEVTKTYGTNFENGTRGAK